VRRKNAYWQGGRRGCYQKKARKVWEKYWHERIPTGNDIHHFDRDFKNNDITNLTMLPHGNHMRLHNSKKNYE